MSSIRRFALPSNIMLFPPLKERLDELDRTEPIPPIRLAVIGIAPNGRNSLALEAAEVVETANLLIGGKRQLSYFPEHSARKITLGADLSKAVGPIRRAMSRGKSVVVLASGDPMLYGIGVMLTRELGVERVDVYPSASSVQLAFGRLGEPWHDAGILSAHGRPIANIIPSALVSVKLAILTDSQNTPSAIAGVLIDAGVEDCRAVVCEQLGSADERIVETSLHALPGQEFDPLNVLLLLRQPQHVRLHFGSQDGEFESVRGQITKAEVRAVTLSKLGLPPHGVLWDIGAGSGSVSIEAARLMTRGLVYAIERDPEQRACMERNLVRHGSANVRLVPGEAPDVLADLPAPDSVFVGGAGGRLSDLLEILPRPFVINLAVPEHLSQVLQRFPESEVVQLNVSRSTPVAAGHRLSALNPVFVVTVPK